MEKLDLKLKTLIFKGHHQEGEETTHQVGGNIHTSFIWEGLKMQNM